MADAKKKMMQWLDDSGSTLVMPGSAVIAEATGEDFQEHSANARKHLTATEKGYLREAGTAGAVVLLDSQGFVPMVHIPTGVVDVLPDISTLLVEFSAQIVRLTDRLTKVEIRYAKLEIWAQENGYRE